MDVVVASYLGGVAGIVNNSTINSTNVYIVENLIATNSVGGIVGKATGSSLDSNMINTNWTNSMATLQASNVGGIVGEAENMISIKENKFTKLILKPTTQTGFVGQIYGKITGNSNHTNNLYGSDLTVDNSVSATFNNLTGSTIQESYMTEQGTLVYYNWVLVE